MFPMVCILMIKKLKCWWLGHRYYTVQQFSPYERRAHCPCCGKDVVMNDQLQVAIDWDEEWERLYSVGDRRIIKPWRDE